MSKIRVWAALTLLSAALAIRAPAGAEAFSISTKLLGWQKSCPVQVIGINKAKTGWFLNDVLVLNAGRSDLQEVQLGLVLKKANGNSRAQGILKTMLGYRIAVAIAPGEAAALGPQPWTVGAVKNMLKSLGPGDYIFTIGIASVMFADGKTLSYVPETDFHEDRAPEIDIAYQRLHPEVVRSFIQAAAARAARMYERSQHLYRTSRESITPLTEDGDGGYFTCDRTSDPIYCTNHYTSCTETPCPTPDNCPKQQCRYIQ